MVQQFDPLQIAQNGYATPRFCTTKPATTPRLGTRLANKHDIESGVVVDDDDNITKLQIGLSARTNNTTIGTGGSTVAGDGQFSLKLMSLGQKIGVNMNFASDYNAKVREETDRLSVLAYDSDNDNDDNSR